MKKKIGTMGVAGKLLSAIEKCTCSFTTVRYVISSLKEHDFVELALTDSWTMKRGGKYYINLYDSGVVAFVAGQDVCGKLRIAAAHTDHPCLYIKSNPEMTIQQYGKLNIEVYGGAILNTWMDRPLSIAGKICLKSDNPFEPETHIVDFKRPLMTIPNLAIHLNRNVNQGQELNKQIDLSPLCTMSEEKKELEQFLLTYIGKELNVAVEDILDFELYGYNTEEGCVLGFDEEFISAPRLDNITSVQACLDGILSANPEKGISMIALFDNEEIGSRTKQGADSVLLSTILEKIYDGFGYDRQEYLSNILQGFFLSVDVAHGLHPNKTEKSDPTNHNVLNHGIVIKRAASQTYATDSKSVAIIEQLCKIAEVPYQKYASRSDGTTGSTLGTIANKYLPMRIVDIGVPILAMHSAREIMGILDQEYLERLIKKFFEE